MEVTTSKRLGSMMFMAALVLWSSIGASARISKECKLKCALFCALNPEPFQCNLECLKLCPRESFTLAALEHCDMGCFLSTCLGYQPGNNLRIDIEDTKKVEADVKKVGACANSCSQGCEKTHSMH